MEKKTENFCIVIHGGAGPIVRELMTKEIEEKYSNKLKEVLETGYKILANGGSSLDAVEASINLMEDTSLFDAGKGAVLNAKGEPEMDASIMEGKMRGAGSVAGVKKIRHPISLAKKVLENTHHVMLFGEGADNFGIQSGLATATKEYFVEEPRYWEILEKSKQGKLLGTVGAVAIDKYGNISAGTSTGGTLNKMQGRIGDSPIIGAGTYADNNTCGISCTGLGEIFIRGVVAHTISALFEYKKMPIEEAARTVLKEKVESLGGEGGIIALDKDGNVAIVYNTKGMFRGYVKSDGVQHISF